TRGPALSNAQCWKIEERHGRVYIAGKTTVRATKRSSRGGPKKIVIVGGGPAALAAADTLRREDVMGTITQLMAAATYPVRRPTQPLEGPSRRDSTGRVDPAQAGRLVPEPDDRARAGLEGRIDRGRAKTRAHGRWQGPRVGRTSFGHGRGADPACDPRSGSP